MSAHAELDYFADRRGSPRGLRQLLRNVDLNWYQIAVVAVATFAVAMDLLFPPVRVAAGQALDVFVGHVFVPLSTMQDAQVDFFWLAVELLGIVAAAVAAWSLGSVARDRRRGPRSLI